MTQSLMCEITSWGMFLIRESRNVFSQSLSRRDRGGDFFYLRLYHKFSLTPVKFYDFDRLRTGEISPSFGKPC